LEQASTIQQAIQQANIPESEMQRLNKRLQEKLALEEALRIQEQTNMQAEIQRIRQELADLRRKEKAPQEETGILGTIKRWWYGGSQETITEEMSDKEQLKLQELLATMKLTETQKQEIEKKTKKKKKKKKKKNI